MLERTDIDRKVISKMIVYIDSVWDSRDFINLLDSVTRLHNYYIILDYSVNRFLDYGDSLGWPTSLQNLPETKQFHYGFKQNAESIFTSNVTEKDPIFGRVERLSYIGNPALEVAKVKFSSPGNFDFLGFGKAFESIKELLFHYIPNAGTKKDIELKQAEIDIKEQELLSKKIDNLKKMGFKQVDIQKIIGLEYNHVDKLLSLKAKGKIVNIDVIGE